MSPKALPRYLLAETPGRLRPWHVILLPVGWPKVPSRTASPYYATRAKAEAVLLALRQEAQQ